MRPSTPASEVKLVLALARGDRDCAIEVIRDGPDWPRVAELAGRHQVDALCGWSLLREPCLLEAGIPPAVVEGFRQAYQRVHLDNQILLGELREVTTALARASIRALVLKGPWLAFRAYPAPGTRPVGDIDLCVSERDFRAVAGALASIGYRRSHASPIARPVPRGRHSLDDPPRSSRAPAPADVGRHGHTPADLLARPHRPDSLAAPVARVAPDAARVVAVDARVGHDGVHHGGETRQVLGAAHYARQIRFHAPHRKLVEVHFRLVNFGPPADEPWLWREARTFELPRGGSIEIPGPAAMLLHLVLHACQHGFASLRLLHDLRWQLMADPPEPAWESFLDRLSALRCRAAAWHALSLAREMAAAPIPEKLLRPLRPGRARRLCFSAAWNLGRVRELGAPRVRQEWELPRLFLLECGSPRQKARYVWELLGREGGVRLRLSRSLRVGSGWPGSGRAAAGSHGAQRRDRAGRRARRTPARSDRMERRETPRS